MRQPQLTHEKYAAPNCRQTKLFYHYINYAETEPVFLAIYFYLFFSASATVRTTAMSSSERSERFITFSLETSRR